MKIKVDNTKIIWFAIIGDTDGSITIDDSIVPKNFLDDWQPEKWLYIDGTISENPDFVPPEPPAPEPSIQDQIDELKSQNETLQEQNQMLTDCLLEMSEIVYGGDM